MYNEGAGTGALGAGAGGVITTTALVQTGVNVITLAAVAIVLIVTGVLLLRRVSVRPAPLGGAAAPARPLTVAEAIAALERTEGEIGTGPR